MWTKFKISSGFVLKFQYKFGGSSYTVLYDMCCSEEPSVMHFSAFIFLMITNDGDMRRGRGDLILCRPGWLSVINFLNHCEVIGTIFHYDGLACYHTLDVYMCVCVCVSVHHHTYWGYYSIPRWQGLAMGWPWLQLRMAPSSLTLLCLWGPEVAMRAMPRRDWHTSWEAVPSWYVEHVSVTVCSGGNSMHRSI